MKAKMLTLLCVLALLAANTAGLGTYCKAEAINNSPQGFILDESNTAQYNISIGSGGYLSVENGDGRFDIVFSPGSLESDSTFEAVPYKQSGQNDSGYVSSGFFLSQKGSGEEITLKSPASICFTTDAQIPKNTMLVKYNENENTYTPIPSHRVSISGVQGLIALTEGFSGYGVKTLSQDEIDKMGDDLAQKGFNWVLTSQDDYLKVIPGEEGGEVRYTAHLEMNLKNTRGTDAWLMQGLYQGMASLLVGTEIFVEGETFYSDFFGETAETNFTLYPVLKVYPSANGGPELIGLVPDYYIGSGTLHFKWNHVKSQKAGHDILDMGAMLGMSSELSEQAVSFSLITSGPFVEITLLDFNTFGPMTFKGMIVGHGRGPSATEPKTPPAPQLEALDISQRCHDDLLRMAEVSVNPDGDIGLYSNNDGISELTVSQGDDGSYLYDLNSDGERDLELVPLVFDK